MMISFIMVIAGLFLLTFGGDFLVRSALAMATRLNVSPFLAGVVVVGFGTSAPELFVSINAVLGDRSEIALGNVVGSNIANVLFIIGASAIFAPIACVDKAIRRDALACLGASFILLVLAHYGMITRFAGVALVLILIIYLWVVALADRQKDNKPSQDNGNADQWGFRKSSSIALLSAATLVFGAEFLVEGASAIARSFGVSDRIIGLTLVAVGTSLPELAAAVVAASKRQPDLIIGNVFGSTLFNIFGILGITAIIVPLPFSPEMTSIDIPISIGAILFLTLIIYMSKFLHKIAGFSFTALYIAYVTILFI